MPNIGDKYLFIAATGNVPADMEAAYQDRWDFFLSSAPEDAEKYFGSVKPALEVKPKWDQFVDVGEIFSEATHRPEQFESDGSKIYCVYSDFNHVFVALVKEA